MFRRAFVGRMALGWALAMGTGAIAAAPASQPSVKPYPLKVCLVSGDQIGQMGPAKVIVYKDREFKLCCADCEEPFRKDPEKYLKMLQAAEKAAEHESPATQPATRPAGHAKHDHSH
ncbi:hypothetical protein [Fontivita pretiosa]|uniref:hypothetical protein n=1 Tax=Fontivita pretiosa TaxID=2989684 RepID=UPI003D16F386